IHWVRRTPRSRAARFGSTERVGGRPEGRPGQTRSVVDAEIARATEELERAASPVLDVAPQARVAGVVDLELVAAEAVDAPEHVGEHGEVEATILLRGQSAQLVEAVARLESRQVDEVAASARPKSASTLSTASSSPASVGAGSRGSTGSSRASAPKSSS